MEVASAKRVFWIALPAVAACPGWPVSACSIPVFQYALERWEPDDYELIVFHSGPMSADEDALIASLEPSGPSGERRSNSVLRRVDLAGQVNETLRGVLETCGRGPLPRLVVRAPPRGEARACIWSGPVDERAVGLVLDSPARREIVRRIAGGDAAVWVFLDSGDRAGDAAAHELLRTELEKRSRELKLPTQPAETGMEVIGENEQDGGKVNFSLVRVSRSDPAEPVLVNILLASEEDLARSHEPMAFPVFGRGRVLYALVGKGINRRNIAEACRFVVEGCSCVVKAENPGIDLLATADWASAPRGRSAGVTDAGSAPAGAVSAEVSGPRPGSMWRRSVLALVASMVVIGIVAWWLSVRDRASPDSRRGTGS